MTGSSTHFVASRTATRHPLRHMAPASRRDLAQRLDRITARFSWTVIAAGALVMGGHVVAAIIRAHL